MRAARIDSFGGLEVLRVVETPAPAVGPGQVRIDVVGSSINPVDIAVRSGWMNEFVPMTPPLTMGTDVAGIVSEVGDGVTDLAAGDRVYGIAAALMGGSGGFAEQAVTFPALLATAPANLDLMTAGTLPLAGVSAFEAITERLNVQPGSRVLVHGAPGGVGLVAVALAIHLGAHVVATAHRNGVAAMKEFGVDDVVDTDVTDLTSLQPFDLTLDLVGADPRLPVQITRPGGRVVGLRTMPDQQAAEAKGVKAELQGTQITTERLNRLGELVERGVVTPHVAQSFDLDGISGAFAVKEAGGVIGKIAIEVG